MTIPTSASQPTSSGAQDAPAVPGNGLPPMLLSATPSGVAGSMSIDLAFSTAMAAGSGTITITDGAVQTVIDRATGQPTQRVVGATDTHMLSAANVHIDGNHVKLDVAGLLPGHTYSVVMGAGVLVSTAQVAFGGVRGASQLQFSTPPAPDSSAPSLVSTGADGSVLKAGGSIVVTLTFSEAIQALSPDALAAPNATVSDLSSSDGGITWRATLTAPAGAVTAASNLLTLDLGKVQDLAGHAGNGSAQLASYAVDTQAPTATVSLDGATLSSSHALLATIRFSEAVQGLGADALSAGHATVSNLHTTDGGVTWLATLSGAAGVNEGGNAGGNVLSVDLAKVQDLAGNAGSGSAVSAAYRVDTQAPANVSIALDGATLSTGNSIKVTFTFTEAVKDLPLDAIGAPHAAITDLASEDGGLTWTATLHASGSGAWGGNALSLDMSKVQDLAGNLGSGTAASAIYRVDTVAPSVTQLSIDAASIDTSHGAGLTIKFSEAVTGLTAAAFSAPHAAISNLHSDDGGLTWTGTLEATDPAASSGNLLTLDASQVHDLAGNAGTSTASAHYDVASSYLGATVVTAGAPLQSGGKLDVTIHFSHAVANLDPAAISAPHASVGNLQASNDHLTWTATLTPADLGVFDDSNAVGVDLTRVHDTAGNAGQGTASSNNYVVDTLVTASVSGIGVQDTGPSASDGVTSDNGGLFSGTLTQALVDDQHVELTIDGHVFGAEIDGTHWFYQNDGLLGDGEHDVSVRVVDADGSHASAAAAAHLTIDTARPQLTATPDGQASFDPAGSLVLQFDKPMYWTGADRSQGLNLLGSDGTDLYIALDDSHFSADRKTITISAKELHLGTSTYYSVHLPPQLSDLAGNQPGEYAINFHTASSDTTPPIALSIAPEQLHPGPYGIGNVVQIDVRFSEAVHLVGNGAPVIQLDNGGHAVLQGLSDDGMEAYFDYTIGAGDNDAHQVDIANTSDLVGRFADAAGNLLDQAHVSYQHLGEPGGYGLEIDTHAPAAPAKPVLSSDTDSGLKGDGVTGYPAPAIVVHPADPSDSLQLYVNGESVAGGLHFEDNGDWSWTLSSLAPGHYSVTVVDSDWAGNASPASAALDLTINPAPAPTAALAAGSDSGSSDHDRLTNVTRPTFTGIAEAGSSVTLYDNGKLLGAATVPTDGGASAAWHFTTPAGQDLAPGSHTITLQVTDNLGHATDASHSTPLTFTIDTSAPDKPGKPALDTASDSGTVGDNITNVNKPTVTGSAGQAGDTIELYEGGALLGTATVKDDKSWSFTIGSQADRPAALADGVHTLTVKEVDAAGNRSVASDALAITIDTVAPTITARSNAFLGLINFYDLQFSEKVVFTKGEVDVLDGANNVHAQNTWNVGTNWAIVDDGSGVPSILHLNLGTYLGLVHLQMTGGAITDVAGNVAIIGSDQFDLHGPTSWAGTMRL